MIIHKTAQKQSGLKLKRWKKKHRKRDRAACYSHQQSPTEEPKIEPMLQRKKRGIMTYNPHAASKTHKQILTWTSLELTPLRGQCNTTSACEVMLTLAWHHRRANRSEANCWHWIYSQTSDGRSSGGESLSVFPFWLPCCPRAWACQWFLENFGLSLEAFVLRNRIFVIRIHWPSEISVQRSYEFWCKYLNWNLCE